MTIVKRLLYFGNDDEFLEKLQNFASAHIKTDYEVEQSKYLPGELLENVSKSGANIVFIDFTSIESREHIFEEILFIKKIDKLKSILFAALLSDTSNIREQLHLYSSGFQMGYVKGTEVEDFMVDCLYIGLAEKVPMATYAKAKGIGKELKVGICSTLSFISLENFKVETDLESESEKLQLKLHLFKELEVDSFIVKSHKSSPYVFPMTETYTLEYPFVGPWDEMTTDTIQKETVETWIDLNNDDLQKKQSFLRVVTNNSNIYRSLLDSTSSLPLFIEVTDKLNFESIKQDLLLKRPPIIFMDLEEDGPTDMDSVGELINNLRKIEQYRPILVILNNLSKADALQKVYGYENIVCMPNPLTIDVFRLFARSFLEKKTQTLEPEGFFFKFSDTTRAVDVFHNIVVTSLSEHEITFVSKIALPMFSVLHLNLPVECFVTIIPPYYELENSSVGKHYMGLIHGLSEEGRQRLRKFVNQIIYEPIKEFSAEVVQATLDQKKIEKRPKGPDERDERDEKDKESKEEVIDYKAFKRPQVQGKSKL
jgi:hypothetical protein